MSIQEIFAEIYQKPFREALARQQEEDECRRLLNFPRGMNVDDLIALEYQKARRK